jgi:hypothetical protein
MRRPTARPAPERVVRPYGGGRPHGPASRHTTDGGRWRRLAKFPKGPSTPTYPLIYGGSLIVALSVPGSVLPPHHTFLTKRQMRIPTPLPRRSTTALASTVGTARRPRGLPPHSRGIQHPTPRRSGRPTQNTQCVDPRHGPFPKGSSGRAVGVDHTALPADTRPTRVAGDGWPNFPRHLQHPPTPYYTEGH